jgi:two-component system, cell cycle sensor histidine kinase PleC
MRSAETSGVGAKGFGLALISPKPLAILSDALTAPFRRLAAEISPITIAVGLTSLAAAGLWIAADFARTLHEVEVRAHVAANASGTQWASASAAMLAGGAPAPTVPLDDVWQRGGMALGAAAIAIGLTFRRRRNSQGEQLRDVLSTIPIGVACWTPDGTLAACNEQYRRRLDLDTAAAQPGAPYHASATGLVRGGSIELVTENDAGRLLELHREDGSCLLIDERPLREGGFVTLVTDVTERRRTDTELAEMREEQRLLARRYHEEKLRAEAASRSKTSFLAHLSHDIRTPLNHIIGFSDMMRQQAYGPLGDARYLGYAEAMKQSGEHLLSFFASILDLAELEGGQKPLRPQTFAVDDLLSSVVCRYSAQAKRARVRFAAGAPCGALIFGDRFSLERMAGNLVENAIRFTPAGGKVNISAFAASDGVVLEISDTGIGMSAERMETLSQPFVFGDAVFASEHGGAGLGIAIARTIAELSGGRLVIDSRPALGTTVAISLPLLQPETETADAA